jgi:hypothetical protein
VEREATPRLLMKPGIQLHPDCLFISNTISIVDISGFERARTTVHNRVHEEPGAMSKMLSCSSTTADRFSTAAGVIPASSGKNPMGIGTAPDVSFAG